MSHMVDKVRAADSVAIGGYGLGANATRQGKPLFEVKWEGYEKKSDRTWEPEENLV